MKFLQKNYFIICILIIASVLRFWELGSVPISPDWDEVALGYNAYSVLHTGKDEYGTFLPRVLRSFDDYKPPLYMYLSIPSIKLFGLSVWAVRLPSAVMGIVAVLGTYLLVRELASRGGRKLSESETLGNVTALLLAVSPWHIQFSRIAFEANSGITLNIWAMYWFLCGLRSSKWLTGSALAFGVALYAYHSERAFVPLILVMVCIVFFQDLKTNWKGLIVPLMVGMLVILPLVPVFTDKTTWTRLQGTSSISDQTALLSRTVAKIDYDESREDIVGKILDNRRIVYAQKLIEGYLSHFSIKWLFFTGDNDRHHAPDMGLLYLWEFPFLLYGMFTVASRGGKFAHVAFAWFFIAPIAAAPTSGLPHAIRTLVFLPTFQIFTATGLISFIERIRNRTANFRIISISMCALVIACSLMYYLHMYFFHLNYEYSQFWQYGYKEAVEYVKVHGDTYETIVVSTKLEQPHMFFLFYLAYDPVKYLAEGGTASGGFAEHRNRFGKFQFRPIRAGGEPRTGRTLYIGTPLEITGDVLHTIHYLNGEEAIRIAH